MSMNKPESQIPEEMLSAYLDGEVTPQEKLEIAAALDKSAEMRALLSDLRQVRLELQSLPKHGLSKDFASSVAKACTKLDDNETQQNLATKSAVNSSRTKMIVGIAATAATLLVALWAVGPARSLFTATTAKVTDARGDIEESGPMSTESNFDQASGVPALGIESAFGVHPQESDDQDASKVGVGRGLTGGLGGRDPQLQGRDRYNVQPAMDALPSGEQETQPNRPFDAVVSVSLSSDQLARNESWRRYRFADGESKRESLGRAALSSQTERVAQSMAVDELKDKDFAIPEGAQLLVMDGTREEISAAFDNMNTIPTSITLLSRNVDSKSLGLPSIEPLASNDKTELGMVEESLDTPRIDLHQSKSLAESAALDAVGEGAPPAELVRREPHASSKLQRAARPTQEKGVSSSSPDASRESERAPLAKSPGAMPNEATRKYAVASNAEKLEADEVTRYRILLIVQPPSNRGPMEGD